MRLDRKETGEFFWNSFHFSFRRLLVRFAKFFVQRKCPTKLFRNLLRNRPKCRRFQKALSTLVRPKTAEFGNWFWPAAKAKLVRLTATLASFITSELWRTVRNSIPAVIAAKNLISDWAEVRFLQKYFVFLLTIFNFDFFWTFFSFSCFPEFLNQFYNSSF